MLIKNRLHVAKSHGASPRVSVVMAVRNGERFVRRAIDSILTQSLVDFEFIIIDDASSDRTGDICREYAARDSRIHLLTNEVNLGLAVSLNQGIRESKGVYVARMDADDVSRRHRLMQQADFLDQNPHIAICGGYIRYHLRGRSTTKRYYEDHERLRAQLLFQPCFSHPAVMFRRDEIVTQGLFYDESYLTTQDYELWTRIVGPLRGANVASVLLDYYCHAEQTSAGKYDAMMLYCRKIHRAQLCNFMSAMSEDELALHDRISIPHDSFSLDELSVAESWLIRIIQTNTMNERFDGEALSLVCFDMWRGVCYQSAALGWATFIRFWQSPLTRPFRISWSSLKLFLKCMIPK